MKEMVPKLHRAVAENREKERFMEERRGHFGDKKECPQSCQFIITGKRAETYCTVASWNVWNRYKSKLCSRMTRCAMNSQRLLRRMSRRTLHLIINKTCRQIEQVWGFEAEPYSNNARNKDLQ